MCANASSINCGPLTDGRFTDILIDVSNSYGAASQPANDTAVLFNKPGQLHLIGGTVGSRVVVGNGTSVFDVGVRWQNGGRVAQAEGTAGAKVYGMQLQPGAAVEAAAAAPHTVLPMGGPSNAAPAVAAVAAVAAAAPRPASPPLPSRPHVPQHRPAPAGPGAAAAPSPAAGPDVGLGLGDAAALRTELAQLRGEVQALRELIAARLETK